MTERAGTVFQGGSRFYVFDDGVKHPGVTSILNCLPKPFLGPWQAKMAAEFAADHMPLLVDLAARDHKAAVELIKGAARRSTAGSADLGTAIHAYAEARMLGDNVDAPISDDEKGMRAAFDQFMVDWRPEVVITEFTVRNDTVGYAGSGDAILNIGGENVIVDYKSGRSVFPEVSAQLAAYRQAERLACGDPLPRIDAAAVLHIRPTGYKLIPVKAGELAYETFKHCRAIFDWEVQKRVEMGAALLPPK